MRLVVIVLLTALIPKGRRRIHAHTHPAGLGAKAAVAHGVAPDGHVGAGAHVREAAEQALVRMKKRKVCVLLHMRKEERKKERKKDKRARVARVWYMGNVDDDAPSRGARGTGWRRGPS